MAQWTVTGAWKSDGRPASVTVEADDHGQASRRAARQGVDVDSARMMPDASAAVPSPVRAASSTGVTPSTPVNVPIPNYSAIVDGAATIESLAGVLRGIGLVMIVLSIVCLVLALLTALSAGFAAVVILTPVVGGFVSGLLLLAAASLLRMVGSIGLAVRDVARNSFGQ